MTQAAQKIVLSRSRDIPFNKLVLSQSNVRRIKAGISVEDLAEDIARRTLLQSLNVRPVLDGDGHETGMFEVPAGGHLEHAGLMAVAVEHGADVEALEQGAPGDVLGQILDRDASLDPAHVGLAQHQLVEGNVPRPGQDDLLGSLGHGRVSVTGGQEPLSRP